MGPGVPNEGARPDPSRREVILGGRLPFAPSSNDDLCGLREVARLIGDSDPEQISRGISALLGAIVETGGSERVWQIVRDVFERLALSGRHLEELVGGLLRLPTEVPTAEIQRACMAAARSGAGGAIDAALTLAEQAPVKTGLDARVLVPLILHEDQSIADRAVSLLSTHAIPLAAGAVYGLIQGVKRESGEPYERVRELALRAAVSAEQLAAITREVMRVESGPARQLAVDLSIEMLGKVEPQRRGQFESIVAEAITSGSEQERTFALRECRRLAGDHEVLAHIFSDALPKARELGDRLALYSAIESYHCERRLTAEIVAALMQGPSVDETTRLFGLARNAFSQALPPLGARGRRHDTWRRLQRDRAVVAEPMYRLGAGLLEHRRPDIRLQAQELICRPESGEYVLWLCARRERPETQTAALAAIAQLPVLVEPVTVGDLGALIFAESDKVRGAICAVMERHRGAALQALKPIFECIGSADARDKHLVRLIRLVERVLPHSNQAATLVGELVFRPRRMHEDMERLLASQFARYDSEGRYLVRLVRFVATAPDSVLAEAERGILLERVRRIIEAARKPWYRIALRPAQFERLGRELAELPDDQLVEECKGLVSQFLRSPFVRIVSAVLRRRAKSQSRQGLEGENLE